MILGIKKLAVDLPFVGHSQQGYNEIKQQNFFDRILFERINLFFPKYFDFEPYMNMC